MERRLSTGKWLEDKTMTSGEDAGSIIFLKDVADGL
jgi:hypothetical protein